MKSKLLFLAVVLVGLTSATATTAGDAVLNGEDSKYARYRFSQPITFVERGVEFLIFPDGSFDFNTEILAPSPNNDDYYYKQNRRRTNRTYGAPGTQYHRRDRGVLIRHDRLGRVRRIGNVFMNYDRQGRIKRVGSVYMNYRRGQLKQVGGLRIIYNRYGEIVDTRGFVNFNNRVNIWHSQTFDDDWNDNWNNDNDFYYYRKNGKIKKQKKLKQ
ncbi:hypothetical protein [uncultured Winogradskyella sp.]|uniref:hypothetical protein n=1 Tax=uncultured Winogradskyella sp. TaxID=395353 RepID=UPI0026243AF7|nr:hypothetical protein [uncultured Winogradskyella sp.]